MGHQITLTLPDSVYETLCDWAQTQKKSVRQVAAETLQAATQSDKVGALSIDTEWHTLAGKSDEELWHIAESQLPPGPMRRWRRLIAKHEAGDILSPDEEHALEMLVEEGERLTALKAEAYALLQQRGHHLPTLEQLRARRRRR
jgi:hypothetical protein